MALFSISCETCGARLKVRSMQALGEIVGCPKCGSMIQVAAPEGWSPPAIAGVATAEDHAPPADAPNDVQQQTADEEQLTESTASRSLMWLGLAAAGLLLVAGLGVAWWLADGQTEVAQGPGALAAPVDPPASVEPDAAGQATETSDPVEATAPAAQVEPEPAAETSQPAPAQPAPTSNEASNAEPPTGHEPPAGEPAETPAHTVPPMPPTPKEAEPPAPAAERTDQPGAAAPAPAVPPRPRSQDLRARLAAPLSSIKFTNVALADVLEDLSQLAGVPISLDAHNVPNAAGLAATPISADLESTTVGAATTAVIRDLGLEGVLVDGQVLIEPRGVRAGKPLAKSYDLADLTSTLNDEQADELRAFLAGLGGAAPQPADRKFTLTAKPERHRLVAEALARLRAGRQTSGADKPGPTSDRWTRTLTLNFRQPTPLLRIVRELESEAQATLLIDWPALVAAGLELDSQVSFVAHDQPLTAALADFAKVQQLAWVTLDDNALLLTSPARAANYLQVDSYPLDHFGPAPRDARQIAALLPAAAGGKAARVWIDPVAKRVLVAGPSPLHAAITERGGRGE
ncbi:MAG: hypothetical protein U0836_04835 [Pirellulales bacterium]